MCMHAAPHSLKRLDMPSIGTGKCSDKAVNSRKCTVSCGGSPGTHLAVRSALCGDTSMLGISKNALRTGVASFSGSPGTWQCDRHCAATAAHWACPTKGCPSAAAPSGTHLALRLAACPAAALHPAGRITHISHLITRHSTSDQRNTGICRGLHSVQQHGSMLMLKTPLLTVSSQCKHCFFPTKALVL